MKRNFNVALQTIEGFPIMEGDKEVQLRTVVINALIATFPDEQNVGGEEKMRRYKLALTIQAAKEGAADITLEDAALIKLLIGKGFGPLIVGQVFALLEGD